MTSHRQQQLETVIETDLKGTQTARLTLRALAIVVVILAALGSGWAADKTLVTFKGSNGEGPLASLIFDAAGNLYGTTCEGGANGNGIVFKLTPAAHGQWKQSLLYSFPTAHNPKGPWGPFSGVIFDAAGNLYGTTYYGGSSVGTYYCPLGCGTVYKLTPTASGAWKETTLYSFREEADGGNPNGGLVFDIQGNLYGTATYGGTFTGYCPNGCGTVFELTPTSTGPWKETVLHSFTGSGVGGDGTNPQNTLTFDTAGNLYGTAGGGAFSSGTVFELSPTSGVWSYAVIHSFPVPVMGGNDGAYPNAGVIADASGNLYGTTAGGGSLTVGAVFELSRDSGGWTSTLLYSFQGLADGSDPKAPLVFDAAGNLYGTVTQNAGEGAVFELSPSESGTWSDSTLLGFEGTDGATPYAGLVLDSEGNLYGTTEFGGSVEDGVVFEITR
jgi:uncharacterized repeat protein (TIGR03803 family)